MGGTWYVQILESWKKLLCIKPEIDQQPVFRGHMKLVKIYQPKFWSVKSDVHPAALGSPGVHQTWESKELLHNIASAWVLIHTPAAPWSQWAWCSCTRIGKMSACSQAYGFEASLDKALSWKGFQSPWHLWYPTKFQSHVTAVNSKKWIHFLQNHFIEQSSFG